MDKDEKQGQARAATLPRAGQPERRAFDAADFTADNGGELVGHAMIVGQWADVLGWFEETLEPGCFDKTDFRDVLFSANVNHDMQTVPLARSRNNNANSTLQLSVDAVGLACKAKLDLENNMHARALHSAVGRKDVMGMSGYFVVGEDRWEGLDTDYPKRHITAIKRVIEITAASMPVFEGTDIDARSQGALESAKRTLESARAAWLESQDAERRARESRVAALRLKTHILLEE